MSQVELQPKGEKGQANGYAELDGTGKVPAAQLPTSDIGAALALVIRSGAYYRPAGPGTTSSKGNIPAFAWIAPIRLPSGHSFDRIGCIVDTATSAGGTARLGVYADDGTGLPGALAVDAGTVAIDSGGAHEATISWTPSAAGVYHPLVIVQSGTGGTLRGMVPLGLSGFSSNSLVGQGTMRADTGISGAFPSTFPAVSWGNDDVAPLVYLRAA
jgi:hypothetical protein